MIVNSGSPGSNRQCGNSSAAATSIGPHVHAVDLHRLRAQEAALAQDADEVDVAGISQRLLDHLRHVGHRHQQRAQPVGVEGFERADGVQVDELRL